MGFTTATPNTKTYFKGKEVPDGYSPHDGYAHHDPVPGKRPWRNAHTNTGNTPPADIDGQSFVPLLENPVASGPERTLIWHYPFNVSVKHPDHGEPLSPHSDIRVGPLKLIWDWHGKLELHHIPNDPFEKHD